MSVLSIIATIECDNCGAHFKVELEEAYTPPQGWTLFDCAIDSVRGGIDETSGRSTSVQNDQTLCADCTKRADEYPREGDE